MILMLVILLCLIINNYIIGREALSIKEKLFIKLPFSVYYGWITVATVANATTLLVSRGWDGFGISDAVWAILILIIAALIGAGTMVINRNVAYGLVLVWAYIGIFIKHISVNGFAGQHPIIISAVVVCILLFVVSLIYILIPRKPSTKI